MRFAVLTLLFCCCGSSFAQTIDATHLVVSPGPGTPDQAGHSMEIIRQLLGKIPILGVCLGHQCLAQVMGANPLAK